MSTTLTPTPTAPPTSSTHATLEIEYWTVEMDRDACSACDTTLVSLQEATEVVQAIADPLDLQIHIVERSIHSWDEALQHSIAASPTIRTGELELRPEHDGLSETRTWNWRGQRLPGPPRDQLIEFLLAALVARSRRLDDYLQAGGPPPYLRQFLEPASSELRSGTPDPASSCCG